MTIKELQDSIEKRVSKYLIKENDSNQRPISKEETENKEKEEEPTKITVRFIKKVK